MWNPFRTRKEVCFIKKTKLKKDGWETSYYTEVDGFYVPNSLSLDEQEAIKFFERVLNLQGETEVVELLKSKRV